MNDDEQVPCRILNCERPAQDGPWCARHQAALEAREAAIEQVDYHADADWKETAYTVTLQLARTLHPFTADDVWDSPLLRSVSTHEPAALGPVFLRAARRGAIVKTGRLVPTRHPRRHRDLTEWRGR